VPSAKALLIQTAVIVGVGAAVGLGDLAYRGGRVTVSFNDTPRLPLPPAPPKDPQPETSPPDAGAPEAEEPVQVADGTSSQDSPAPAPEPAPAPQPPPQPGVDCESMEAPPEWDANHITVARAFSLFESGQAVFVDARIEQDYLFGHIPNAAFLPISAFETGFPDRVKYQMDPDAITVVYCSGGDDCEAAEDVAIELRAAQFTSLYILHDGMPGWVACGHPVQQGEDPNAF
jgi:rhodanese-related sulfurtransferase